MGDIPVDCPACDGSGEEAGDGWDIHDDWAGGTCPWCGGSGKTCDWRPGNPSYAGYVSDAALAAIEREGER